MAKSDPPIDLEVLRPWITRHERPCWRAVTETGDDSPTVSKFGGTPCLLPGETHPVCQRCGRPLQLFLQLDLADVPVEIGNRFGLGLLQLFYCASSSTPDCDGAYGWEAFSDTCSKVRILPPKQATERSPEVSQFPAQRIVGWTREIDHPSGAELDSLGVKIDYHFKTVPYHPIELICEELGVRITGKGVDDRLVEFAPCLDGDKLAGWPCWSQGAEYPSCPDCGKTMQLVFQLDSNRNVPFMFGDVGIGHLTQCPACKDVVAFAWACG